MYGWQASGTHPTGMLSCYLCFQSVIALLTVDVYRLSLIVSLSLSSAYIKFGQVRSIERPSPDFNFFFGGIFVIYSKIQNFRKSPADG